MYIIEVIASGEIKVKQPDGKSAIVTAEKAIQAIELLKHRGLHATVLTRYQDRNIRAEMRSDVVNAAAKAAGLGALAAAKAAIGGKIEF